MPTNTHTCTPNQTKPFNAIKRSQNNRTQATEHCVVIPIFGHTKIHFKIRLNRI